MCQKPGPHSHLSGQSREDEPVHHARLTAPSCISVTRGPARATPQQSGGRLTLPRATTSLPAIGVLGAESASTGLASVAGLMSFAVVLILGWACITFTESIKVWFVWGAFLQEVPRK